MDHQVIHLHARSTARKELEDLGISQFSRPFTQSIPLPKVLSYNNYRGGGPKSQDRRTNLDATQFLVIFTDGRLLHCTCSALSDIMH